MNRLAYWVLVLPPLFWAGNFTVGKAISGQIYPVTLAHWRWLLAGLVLLPLVIRPMWRQREIILTHWKILLVMAILGVSTFNTLVYYALTKTTATNAVLLNSFIPILIFLLSVLFFGGKVSRQQLFGVVISLSGVMIIVSQFSLMNLLHLELNVGDLWMILAALVWALYSLLLKSKKPADLSPEAFLGVVVIVGYCVLWPIYLVNPLNEPPLSLSTEALLSLFYIAIFPSVLAFHAWHYGVDKLGANIAGQYLHLMPFFGVVLAVIFLDEQLQFYHFLSAIFIAAGLYLSLKTQRRSLAK